eukprot:g32707.t1
MAFAVQAQKPSAIVPCNECVHFFPPLNQTYEAYCEATHSAPLSRPTLAIFIDSMHIALRPWGLARHGRTAAVRAAGDAARRTAPRGTDVFRCEGLTAEVTRLRRKTQATVALDLLGAPYAKVLGHHFDFENFMTVTEQLASNSTFVLLLHAGAVWYYQAFLRDHLMARHVTRITLERVEAEITVAYVETGPWLRRVELGRQAPSPSSVSFRRLLTNGCLHVDRRLGTISDEADT